MEGIVSALIASAAAGVSFVLDVGDDGVPALRWADDALERILGVDPGELTTRDLFNLVHPEDVGAASQAFGALLVGKGASVTFRLLNSDGIYRRVHVDAHARLRWPGGQVATIYGRMFPVDEAPGREAG